MKILAADRLVATRPFKVGDPVRFRLHNGPLKEGYIESVSMGKAFVNLVSEDAIQVSLDELEHA